MGGCSRGLLTHGRDDAGGEFRNPRSGPAAGHLAVLRPKSQALRQLPLTSAERRTGELIGLGKGGEDRPAAFDQQLLHLQVFARWIVPNVEQPDDTRQALPST